MYVHTTGIRCYELGRSPITQMKNIIIQVEQILILNKQINEQTTNLRRYVIVMNIHRPTTAVQIYGQIRYMTILETVMWDLRNV